MRTCEGLMLPSPLPPSPFTHFPCLSYRPLPPPSPALFFGYDSGEVVTPSGQAIGSATVIVRSKGTTS